MSIKKATEIGKQDDGTGFPLKNEYHDNIKITTIHHHSKFYRIRQVKVTYPPALHPKKRDDCTTFAKSERISQSLGILPRNSRDA